MEDSICIGIISYLPDNENIRKERQVRINKLISQLDEHFNLPIILIAQNYKDFNINSKNIILYNYDKLGITGARIKLREKFLESDYNYIIMLDDDMELSDKQIDYNNYIDSIIKNKKDHYYVGNFLVNFCTMSKQGFTKVTFDKNIDPEKQTGFEDWVFTEKCKKYLNSMKLITNLPKYDRKHFLKDNYSTWNTDDKYKKVNEQESMKIIKLLKNGTYNKSNINMTGWF